MSEPRLNSRPVILISVDQRFQSEARKGGGISKDQAVASAEESLTQMEAEIETWIDSSLARLEARLKVDVAAGKFTNWPDVYDTACSLQDVCGSAGFYVMTEIAGSLCELLEAIHSGSDFNGEALRCCVSALRLTRHESYRGTGIECVPDLASGLAAMVLKLSSSQGGDASPARSDN